MFDEEQESLAAEYVLGTLSATEREHAEALLSFDVGFEAAVRQWERRLGELNVMVEAVEPPPELWNKVKHELTPAAEATKAAAAPPQAAPTPAGELAADLVSLEAVSAPPTQAETSSGLTPPVAAPPPSPAMEPSKIERSPDVIYLVRRVRRWRGTTVAFGAIAALLALYIAVWQAAPDLIPLQLRPHRTAIMAPSPSNVTARSQQDRLVAVLQQGPTAPAFLLTLDTAHRMVFVRRVSATPETGKSYELWMISSRFGSPRSLGLVGNDEFTQRALPGSYDTETLRTASYAVSLEPAGGSKSGAPTGPILFTGKAVEIAARFVAAATGYAEDLKTSWC